MPASIKDWLVVFSENGEDIESTKDITNPNAVPRKRRIVVRAKTAGQAERAAKTLYTYAE